MTKYLYLFTMYCLIVSFSYPVWAFIFAFWERESGLRSLNGISGLLLPIWVFLMTSWFVLIKATVI